MRVTKKSQIDAFLLENPNAMNAEIYEQFPNFSRRYIKQVKSAFFKNKENQQLKLKGIFNPKKALEEMIMISLRTHSIAYFNFWRLYFDTYVHQQDGLKQGNLVSYSLLTAKLTPKQREIFNEMISHGWIKLLGSRKTGKTFLIALAIILLGSQNKLEVHVLSSKKETASYVIYMIINIVTELKLDILSPQQAKQSITFINGTRVIAHSNTLADTGTYEADILVMDEAQEIEEEVWAKIVPQLATGRTMRVYIMGTAKAGTPFQVFWNDNNPRFKKYKMGTEDATWVTEEAWSSVKSLMSDRMVRQELMMEWVEPEGAFFRSEEVERAFKPFKIDIDKMGEIICAADWGAGHETVLYVLGIQNKQIKEIESWGMYNPNTKQILAKCQEFHEKYHCLFILEGSPLGSFVRKDIKLKKYSVKISNFGSDKDQFWLALQLVLNRNRLHLKNPACRQQLLVYRGDKKNDDYVDALLHGVRYLYKKYLKGKIGDKVIPV